MRPRLIRRVLARHLRPPTKTTRIRTFTQNSPALYNARPQLPFLSIPSRFQRQQWRYLTTERKTWLKREAILGVKYTGYIWAIFVFAASAAFAVQQELLERRHPTPHEWSFRTRMLKRGADAEKSRTDVVIEDWVLLVQLLTDVIARLEDPRGGDGEGLRDLGPDRPPGSKDITAMPEPWRRGYFEALLLQAQASEHVEGWVIDRTRGVAFPPDVVRGPSNPFPKPIPPGSKSAPREEDCDPAGFPGPDQCYLKLLSTEGLTPRQRMDAALSYANWLEIKGLPGPAAVIYDDAVALAVGEMRAPEGVAAPPLVDPKTAVLSDRAGLAPSENLLRSLTALATFKARYEDVSAAMPIMISILKARRSLPDQPPISNSSSRGDGDLLAAPSRPSNRGSGNPLRVVLDLFKPPDYPPPPPDGSSPPVRDSKELCEEAALHLHIGEIMYTLQASTREDGLAWTREGVDLAEEELHKVLQEDGAGGGGGGVNNNYRDAKKTCRECLASGLDNWAAMVGRMARDEQAARANGEAKSSSSGWFGLWSGGKGVVQKEGEEAGGRWAAEHKVVTERTMRAQPILEDLQKPPSGLMSSLLKA